MTAKLETSRAYDLFESNSEQRPIRPTHVKSLSSSMRDHGFLPSKPVQVFRRGKKFVVIDGHHRLAAARVLGIPFFYVVEDQCNQNTMAPVNVLVKTWTFLDFIRLYAARGIAEYQELLRYIDMGIPANMAASLLWNESAGSGNAGEYVKAGTFKIKSRENIRRVVLMIESFSEKNSVVKHRAFIDAISRCMFTPDFDFDRLFRRFEENPNMIGKASNVDLQLDQIEELYNFRSRDKWPLAFHVRETSAKRKILSTPKAQSD